MKYRLMPSGSDMKWQRYVFEEVPSFDRAEAQAIEEISRLTPGPEATRAFRVALAMILGDLRTEGDPAPHPLVSDDGASPLAMTERLTIRHAGLASRDDWTAGAYVIRITYGLGGDARRAIVETPLSSGRSLIGRVVGVSPARLGASDLLTPVEQGILSFFAETIASGLTDRVPFLAPLLPMPLLDITSESAPIDWGSDGPRSWYAISGSALIAGTIIPFRLLLPWVLLRQVRSRYEASPEGQDRTHRRALYLMHPFAELPVTLTGRIGRITLRRAELEEVETNDVVLLDETVNGPLFEAGHVTGTMRIAFDGSVESVGCVEVHVIRDDAQLTVSVARLLPGRSPERTDRKRRMQSMNRPGDDEQESTDVPRGKNPGLVPGTTEATEGAALAEEAPVQVRVELGRAQMTLRELSQLAPGAILDLRKHPEQPVALMIEDRMIARGELVRVEGVLGVRILSIF